MQQRALIANFTSLSGNVLNSHMQTPRWQRNVNPDSKSSDVTWRQTSPFPSVSNVNINVYFSHCCRGVASLLYLVYHYLAHI